MTVLTKAQLREILGPNTRRLEGNELSQMWLILQFLDPFDESNNQQWCTEKYKYNSEIYHVHFINSDIPMIEVEID